MSALCSCCHSQDTIRKWFPTWETHALMGAMSSGKGGGHCPCKEEVGWLLSGWWQPDLWSGVLFVSLWLCVTCVASEQLTVLFPLSSETMGCVLGVFNMQREDTQWLFFFLRLERVNWGVVWAIIPSPEGGPRFPRLFPLLEQWRWVKTACAPHRHLDVAYPLGVLYCSWHRVELAKGRWRRRTTNSISLWNSVNKRPLSQFQREMGGGQVSEGLHWWMKNVSRAEAVYRLQESSGHPLPQAGSIFPAPWDYGF